MRSCARSGAAVRSDQDRSRHPSTHAAQITSPSRRLPVGAEAAIWSILEAVPDPRNHLALTRDLTGEVRIAGTPLDPEVRARRDAGPAPGTPWIGEPTVAVSLADGTLDLRDLERAS